MDNPEALYVHLPFCHRKCPYCDFYSVAGREDLSETYVQALQSELAQAAASLPPLQLRSVYLGGGTPTRLPVSLLAELVHAGAGTHPHPDGCEVTCEANPGTVDRASLRALRQAGVNRLSLGIQSLRDDELRFLGRVHTADEARRTAGDARDAGFENLSLDLIYCLPGQTPATWKETLDAALALQPDHFSAYCLQIEEDTPFAARVAGGEFEPLDDDRQAEMYLRTAQILSEAGYQHYEVSNFALPGRRCVHNLTYWHNEPYLGIGAAAWSYLNGERRGNVRDVDAYLEAWRTRQSAVAYRERCGPVQAANETLMMALRLAEGIDLAAFAGRHGVDLATHRADDIGSLSEAGLIGLRGSRLALTTRGLAVATEITALLALSEEEGSP